MSDGSIGLNPITWLKAGLDSTDNGFTNLLSTLMGDQVNSGATTTKSAATSWFQGKKADLGFGATPQYQGEMDARYAKEVDGRGVLQSKTNKGTETTGPKADAKTIIEGEMGKEFTEGWGDLTPQARQDLYLQAITQRASRLTNRFTNMLSALHEMSMAVIRNLKA